MIPLMLFFFFFNDTATTEIYTLSLHDALPIYPCPHGRRWRRFRGRRWRRFRRRRWRLRRRPRRRRQLRHRGVALVYFPGRGLANPPRAMPGVITQPPITNQPRPAPAPPVRPRADLGTTAQARR